MRAGLSEWIQQAINLDSKGDAAQRNECRVKRVAPRHVWKTAPASCALSASFGHRWWKPGRHWPFWWASTPTALEVHRCLQLVW